MSSRNTKKYWAFISYSSKDKKWGKWLHNRLENYPIPKEFQGTKIFDGDPLGKNLSPCFRDRDELPGAADLGPPILKALKNSRYLVVLCSKNSAKSKWVDKEITDFKALHPENEKRILALILDGEPNATINKDFPDSEECFPPSLRAPHEPLAGDLRKEGDGKERGFLKVLSGISQIGFDELYRRHERIQRKKRLIVGGTATLIIAILTGLSLFAFEKKRESDHDKLRAEQQLSRAHYLAGLRASNQDRSYETLPLLLQSIKLDRTFTTAADQLAYISSSAPQSLVPVLWKLDNIDPTARQRMPSVIIESEDSQSYHIPNGVAAISSYNSVSLSPRFEQIATRDWSIPNITSVLPKMEKLTLCGFPAVSPDRRFLAVFGTMPNEQLGLRIFTLPDLNPVKKRTIPLYLDNTSRIPDVASIGWRRDSKEIMVSMRVPSSNTVRVDTYTIASLELTSSNHFRTLDIPCQYYVKYPIGLHKNQFVKLVKFRFNPHLTIRTLDDNESSRLAPEFGSIKYSEGTMTYKWPHGFQLKISDYTNNPPAHSYISKKTAYISDNGEVSIIDNTGTTEPMVFQHPATDENAMAILPTGLSWTPDDRYLIVSDQMITGSHRFMRIYDTSTGTAVFSGTTKIGAYVYEPTPEFILSSGGNIFYLCKQLTSEQLDNLISIQLKLSPWLASSSGVITYSKKFIPPTMEEFQRATKNLESLWADILPISAR